MNTTPLPAQPAGAPLCPPDLVRLVKFFESLSPDSVARMGTVYDIEARFVDPFNDVQGLQAIERIFSHMFAALEKPFFVVTGQSLPLQAFSERHCTDDTRSHAPGLFRHGFGDTAP
jgi:hypothetical protein